MPKPQPLVNSTTPKQPPSQSSPNPPSQPMEKSGSQPLHLSQHRIAPLQPPAPLDLEPTSFYILLSELKEHSRFHCGLYYANEAFRGRIFHCTDAPGPWIYESKPTFSIPHADSILVALKIGTIDPLVAETLDERLCQVPLVDSVRWGQLCCTTWAFEAVKVLDDEGYIALTAPVEQVRIEALDLAFRNGHGFEKKRRTVEKSAYMADE